MICLSGIGCIHMSLIDGDEKPVQVYPGHHRVRPEVYEAEFYWHTLREFSNVRVVTQSNLDSKGLCIDVHCIVDLQLAREHVARGFVVLATPFLALITISLPCCRLPPASCLVTFR